MREWGPDAREGSESGSIAGQEKKKDQMHWKVANQTVKIVKKREREGVPVW